jgi:FKBP-type peptidyl-prolyl cis-trans isomerase SlyD
MQIEKDRVVTLSYQLFTVDKEKGDIIVEERSVDDPLEFIFGRGVLLKKVEEQLKGQSRGYQAQVELHPYDAFGVHKAELALWMPKDRFPSELELKLGMKFQTQGPGGDVISVIVKEIEEKKVLVDGNHPLAGLHLKFDLRVLRVREATEKELVSGKVDSTQLH